MQRIINHDGNDNAGMHDAQVQEWRYPEMDALPQCPPMGDEAQQTIREWIQGVLDRTGWSAGRFAKKAGVAPSTVTRALDEKYEFVPTTRTIAKLAAVADAPPPDIKVPPPDKRLVPKFLAVRYRVRAGHWFELDTEEPPEQLARAVVPDPEYAEFPQWLELVEGDSFDLEIKPGHYAHVVDAKEMGYRPKSGDWVIVERHRDDGAIRERTIKEVVIDQDGRVMLWPRSSNPKWQEPVDLRKGARNGEDVQAFIVGLVLGSYSPARRG